MIIEFSKINMYINKNEFNIGSASIPIESDGTVDEEALKDALMRAVNDALVTERNKLNISTELASFEEICPRRNVPCNVEKQAKAKLQKVGLTINTMGKILIRDKEDRENLIKILKSLRYKI